MSLDHPTIPYIQDTLALCTHTNIGEVSINETLVPNREVYPSEEIHVDNLLGKGGMGIVYKESQEIPNRSVAVKKLIRDTPDQRESLIREADVMGRLEHPNIPPVHVVQTDPPQVTMKLIDGMDFSDILKRTPQRGKSLDRALEVIIKVTHALEFAHNNGVIHRDIKPENIMVGGFDEVYLMDWGISIDKNSLSEVPTGIAGTPSYMAPEMLCQKLELLGPHTDIFLMGALLHEVLVGKTRYFGSTLGEVFQKVTECSQYTYSEDVPTELAEICNRACAREITSRYQSIVDFRYAIQEYIRHASAMTLALAAEQKRQEVICSLSSEQGKDLLDSRYFTLAAQARFGFEQALESWGECTIALDGLQSILSLMIRRSIFVGDFQQAKQMIEELINQEYKDELELLCFQEEEKKAREDLKNEQMQLVVDNLDPTKSFDARYLIQASLTITLLIMFVLS